MSRIMTPAMSKCLRTVLAVYPNLPPTRSKEAPWSCTARISRISLLEGGVPEDDTTFPKETGESLMSKTNLPGHGFQRPARCGWRLRLCVLRRPARIDWCARTI